MRNHPLTIGEVVFDLNAWKFGIITKLTDKKAVLEQGVDIKHNFDCNNENTYMFDEENENDAFAWETDDLNALYQIAWGVKDNRWDCPVLFEHTDTRDNYPYYSPYFDENLFSIETHLA